ncbi:HdeD family acid-resistance protein [Actinophytocola sp.]|uniref:HdeD family acid-resistance protein n=1 Tax=Actinophytocola sp. TaxID=1872138 RepID=UPI00389A1D93
MSYSSALLWRGLLAVVIGIVSVAWPGVTVGAVVLLFAVYAFVAAAADTMRAFSSDRVGPVVGYLLLAVLSLVAGVIAIAWPGITALVLTIWVAAWAVVTGVTEVAMAFQHRETTGERAMWGLTGLVSIGLGVVLFIRPDIGALSLATVFGLFSLFYGISALILYFQHRQATTHRTTAPPRGAGVGG